MLAESISYLICGPRSTELKCENTEKTATPVQAIYEGHKRKGQLVSRHTNAQLVNIRAKAL